MAAEQTNIWFGKFLPIVCKMTQVHSKFFLDEMITIRNKEHVKKLQKRGLWPCLVPVEELKLPRKWIGHAIYIVSITAVETYTMGLHSHTDETCIADI